MIGTQTMPKPPSENKLTGLSVLLILVGFFGVIMVVNFVMAYYALHTFSGMQTEKPYESGLAYNRAISDAKAQVSRGWHVDARIERQADGSVGVTAEMKDVSSAPIHDLAVVATLRSPIDSKLDHSVKLAEEKDGSYRGTVNAAAVQWDAEIIAEQNGIAVFKSINRIIIH